MLLLQKEKVKSSQTSSQKSYMLHNRKWRLSLCCLICRPLELVGGNESKKTLRAQDSPFTLFTLTLQSILNRCHIHLLYQNQLRDHLFVKIANTSNSLSQQNFKIGTGKNPNIFYSQYSGERQSKGNGKRICQTNDKVFLWISILIYKTHIKTAHNKNQIERSNDWIRYWMNVE